MISEFTSTCRRLALFAAFGLAVGVTQASAADLGGDCCADLEERIAELEATTARKGNRKVSLTISGWVNEAVFAWDDGVQRNAFVGTNDLEQTRIRFVGEARIAQGYSAGYTLEIGSDESGSKGFSQSGYGTTQGLTVRKSNWWLKSDAFGKVTVGQEGSATYHLLDDADIANTRNFYDAQADGSYQGAFRLRGAAAAGNPALKWSDVMRGADNSTPGQSTRLNIIRYDSPTIAGFTVTAAWGADDMWDAKLNYTKALGEFNVIGQVGYGENTDETVLKCHPTFSLPTNREDCQFFGAAGSIMHVPTGLYVYGGWGQQVDNTRDEAVTAGNASLVDDTDTMWFIQAGIEQKWISLGKTTIFGQYRHDDAGSNPSANNGTPANYVQDSNLNFYAAGVVQNIDAAAMDLYLMYRHGDGDVHFASTASNAGIDGFDMVIGGALIKF